MPAPALQMTDSTYDKIGQAIHETFSSVLSLKLQITEIQVGTIQNPPRNISGFVVLRNPKVQGTFSIGFPNQTALQIFSNFYGSKIEQIDERVLEGVGEITNMVYGVLKKRLNEEGLNLEMFIPFIVVGNEFCHLKDLRSESAVTIHFGSIEGSFWVELNVQKQPKVKNGAVKKSAKKPIRKKPARKKAA